MPNRFRCKVSASTQRAMMLRLVKSLGRSARRIVPSELRASNIVPYQFRVEGQHREAFERDRHVSRIDLHAIADTSELVSGKQCRARAAERIVNQLAGTAAVVHHACDQLNWFLGGM